MITEKTIRALIDEKLEGSENYLVDLTVSASNQIRVELDHLDGISIDECVAMSRHIDSSFDREIDDFELQVSSPGLDQPFKVFQQYVKNIGREVSIVKVEGQKLKGLLIDANQAEVTLEYETKEKVEGKKKKELIVHQDKIPMNEIKETRIIISFK
jgi:ribosome maturation factor RimP